MKKATATRRLCRAAVANTPHSTVKGEWWEPRLWRVPSRPPHVPGHYGNLVLCSSYCSASNTTNLPDAKAFLFVMLCYDQAWSR